MGFVSLMAGCRHPNLPRQWTGGWQARELTRFTESKPSSKERAIKAIQTKQYGGEVQLELVEVPKPQARKGQVVVRIFATRFNSIDVKLTSGNMRQVMPLQFRFVPGVDFSSVVDSVGEGVSEFRAGDEVWGYPVGGGSYAEYLAVDADKIASKPKALNHIEAAALALVGQTALQAVDLAGVQKGQTVLIHGAGGAVGSVAGSASARCKGHQHSGEHQFRSPEGIWG
jgi:NADPH:quinone reductase-like Zn-dependent oxidoreductase